MYIALDLQYIFRTVQLFCSPHPTQVTHPDQLSKLFSVPADLVQPLGERGDTIKIHYVRRSDGDVNLWRCGKLKLRHADVELVARGAIQ